MTSMFDESKGVRDLVTRHDLGDGVEVVEYHYRAWSLCGTEVDLTPWNGRMPTAEEFMEWASSVSGLRDRVFQRGESDPAPDLASRFDPAKEFEIDRALFGQEIMPGDIIAHRRPYWEVHRPVMVMLVNRQAVTVIEERRRGETTTVEEVGRRVLTGVRALDVG